MRIFDETKTRELTEYDSSKGHLKLDKLFIKSHPYIPASSGIGHYDYKHYPNGGVERKWVWDYEPTEEQEAWDEYEEIQVYVYYTAEELQNKRISEIKSRLSQLSEDFTQAWAGAQIADIEARKREFAELHNELRGLFGKEPRVYY
jgi:hypothetical protein